MKIRNQFFILLSGILLIPIITLSAYVLVRSYRSPEQEIVRGYEQLDFSEMEPGQRKSVNNAVKHLPPFMKAAILNSDMRIIYSDIAAFETGKTITLTEVLTFGSSNKTYHYQISRSNGLLIISQIERNSARRRPPMEEVYEKIGAAILILIFVFCCLIITKIARSISTSVMLLDDATKRIASGDLETNIDIGGSNEITSLAHSLNTMRQSLKEMQIRKSRFIMGVSHDLRTPLSLIKGYTEAIADGMAETPVLMQKSLGIISLKINQLEEMIDDLINFTKLDSGDWQSTSEDKEIFPILQNFAENIKEDANLFGHTADIKIDVPKDTKICLNEKIFVRVLENLCNNAFRYTPKGGTISFIASRIESSDSQSRGKIKIVIRDTGIGIEQSDMPFIFDPFYRGSNSRREDGKGLGLAVVKTVVESYGWKIDVTSQKNVGTEFTLIM